MVWINEKKQCAKYGCQKQKNCIQKLANKIMKLENCDLHSCLSRRRDFNTRHFENPRFLSFFVGSENEGCSYVFEIGQIRPFFIPCSRFSADPALRLGQHKKQDK